MTTKISYKRFFVDLFVLCHDPWAYRGQKEENGKKERDLGMVLLTSLRVYFHNCGLHYSKSFYG